MLTLVMKFGGASVASPGHFAKIAKIICTRALHYDRIVVVVSAMGRATDELLALAHEVHREPPRRELDMLISVGERVSISLLAMALDLEGKQAISFTGSQSGIITSNEHADARILEIRPHRLVRMLQEGKIVIVAGFQGVSRAGEITTLGRGGSDTSAVAIAAALNAQRVEFFKDVAGIYSADPKKDLEAHLLSFLSYGEAIEIAQRGAKVLHLRALLLAQRNGIPLHVISFDQPEVVGTVIAEEDMLRPSEAIFEEEGVYAHQNSL